MPDGYGQIKEINRDDRIQGRQQQDKLHSEPFCVNKNKKLLKYEYPFQDNKEEKFVYGFLCQGDPYEACRDEKNRAMWIEEANMLFGQFRPSGPQKPISTIQKSRLQEIVEFLKRLLLSDWNDVNFVIGTNPNDQIEIKFDL